MWIKHPVVTDYKTTIPKDMSAEERSDSTMTYDEEEHRYILTVNYVKNKRNEDLEAELGATGAKAFLDEISEKVYAYIKKNIDRENYQVLEYKLAHQKEYRLHMRRILLAMVMYALRSDGDLVGEQTGIDIANNQVISLDNLRGKIEVSGHVYNLLTEPDLNFLFKGEYVNSFIHKDDYRSDY